MFACNDIQGAQITESAGADETARYTTYVHMHKFMYKFLSAMITKPHSQALPPCVHCIT